MKSDLTIEESHLADKFEKLFREFLVEFYTIQHSRFIREARARKEELIKRQASNLQDL